VTVAEPTLPSTPTGPASTLRRLFSRPLVLYSSLFLAGTLISGFTFLQGIDPFDEGLMLQAARRVAAGQIIYRDFRWSYGPAQPYLLAALIKLFGVSLVHWRVIRAFADAAVALISFVLVRSAAPRAPLVLPLAVWLAVACEMAEPRSANPFAFALLAVLIGILLVSRGDDPPGRGTAIGAAVLTAVAAAFRLDFAIYGFLAIVVVLGLRCGLRTALAYGATAVALTVLVYLPFAIADHPGRLYHQLVGLSLGTGSNWSLPFPLHYHAPPHAGLAKTLKHALDFYVPLLVVVGFAVMVAAAAHTLWRERRAPLPSVALIVFGAGALAYLLSRTDEFHTQPLFVVVAIGLAIFAASSSRPLAAVSIVLLATMGLHGVANRLSALARPPAESTLNITVADGVMVPPREARALERVMVLVDGRVPPGQPIYVLPRRSDLVRINDPLLYVLTERDNPTPNDFGLLTGAAAQAQIVRTLSQVRPRIIVRWTDPISSSREPNLRGRSSGVHTVDNWVAVHYRLLARLYHYDVLTARG
jgi:hypothetical protein